MERERKREHGKPHYTNVAAATTAIVFQESCCIHIFSERFGIDKTSTLNEMAVGKRGVQSKQSSKVPFFTFTRTATVTVVSPDSFYRAKRRCAAVYLCMSALNRYVCVYMRKSEREIERQHSFM